MGVALNFSNQEKPEGCWVCPRIPPSPLHTLLISWQPEVGKNPENPRFSWLLLNFRNWRNYNWQLEVDKVGFLFSEVENSEMRSIALALIAMLSTIHSIPLWHFLMRAAGYPDVAHSE